MKKRFLAFVVVFSLVALSSIFLSGCKEESDDSEESETFETWDEERQAAIDKAKEVYEEKKADGMDFSDGPCIDDDLMDNWVADIAHIPRTGADDNPENQCPSYGDDAMHFVELDENGELIKAR